MEATHIHIHQEGLLHQFLLWVSFQYDVCMYQITVSRATFIYKEYLPNFLENTYVVAPFFLFFELETSNFGYLLISKFSVQSFSKIEQT
jgi:hypothetical protein